MKDTFNISRKEAMALLNQISDGNTPTRNAEQILVGRGDEISAVLNIFDIIKSGDGARGSSAMKFVVGRNGAGKTFFLQIVKSYAIRDGFVTANATFNDAPMTSKNIYCQLMRSLSTPLEAILASLRDAVGESNLLTALWNKFNGPVSTESIGSRDYIEVLLRYYEGLGKGDFLLMRNAADWLLGEYHTIPEATRDLGVHSIIRDDNWTSALKLFCQVAVLAGFNGLFVLLDEGTALYMLPNCVIRDNNYKRLLSLYDPDSCPNMFTLVAGIEQFLFDSGKGLCSNLNWRSRLDKKTGETSGTRNFSRPWMSLKPLSPEGLYTLLCHLNKLYGYCYGANYGENGHDEDIDGRIPEIVDFLNRQNALPGGLEAATPRELCKQFLSELDLLPRDGTAPDTGAEPGDGAADKGGAAPEGDGGASGRTETPDTASEKEGVKEAGAESAEAAAEAGHATQYSNIEVL